MVVLFFVHRKLFLERIERPGDVLNSVGFEEGQLCFASGGR